VSEGITTRWVDGPTCSERDWDAIDQKLAARGWMALNRKTSRILVAERDGRIVALYCLQLVPHVEPLLVDRSEFGTGLAEELADTMQAFLVESHTRGFMAVCEHPVAAKMCEARGMVKVTYPVYVTVPEGEK
jgi:hypothetical protein